MRFMKFNTDLCIAIWMDCNFPAEMHVIDGVRSHSGSQIDAKWKKYAAGQGDRTHAKCGQKFSKCVENFPSVWKIEFS